MIVEVSAVTKTGVDVLQPVYGKSLENVRKSKHFFVGILPALPRCGLPRHIVRRKFFCNF